MAAPVDSALVEKLRELANQIAAAAPDAVPLAELATPTGFSLQPVLVDLFAAGGAANGGLLCAVQTAATTVGVNNQIALAGCQSPLLTGLRALAIRAAAQIATPAAAGHDPAVQQALEFSANVSEAPCGGSASDSAACLNTAATELQARQEEEARAPQLP